MKIITQQIRPFLTYISMLKLTSSNPTLNRFVGLFMMLLGSSVYAASSVSPNPAYAGDLLTFTEILNGDLPSGYTLKISFEGSSNDWLSENVLQGGPRTFTYQRTISTAGVDRRYRIAIFLNSTRKTDWEYRTYTVYEVPQPSISSVSPTTAVKGVYTYYTVRGSDLPSNMRANIEGSTTNCTQSGLGSQATLRCRADVVGHKRFYIKTSAGVSISGSSSIYIDVTDLTPKVTSVTPNPNPPVVGQSVTFTAQTDIAASQVKFKFSGGSLQSMSSSNGGRTWTYVRSEGLSDTTVKTYYLYVNGSSTSSKSGTIQAINPVPQVTSVTPNPNPPVVGQSVTFTAQTDIAASQVKFKFSGGSLQSMSSSNGGRTWTYIRTEGLADTSVKTYYLYINGSSTVANTGTVQAVSAPAIVSGYPKAVPNSVDIGEPVEFELNTTADVSKIEIDMGGGSGFQDMHPVVNAPGKEWGLTRSSGFVTSGNKPVDFKIFDLNGDLIAEVSITVSVSSNIYPRPYRYGNPSAQGVPAHKGVALLNGNLYRQFVDMSVSNRGLDFILSRSFNREVGWRFNYGQMIEGDENAVTVKTADGSDNRYYKSVDDNLWYAHDRSFDILREQADGSFDLYTKSGIHYHFSSLNAGGKLQSVSDRNNNKLILTYGADGYLASVTDDQSRSYTFTINTSGDITRVSDFTGRHVDYTWNYSFGDGRLVSVLDLRGNKTEYRYSSVGNLIEVIDPRLNSIKYTYDTEIVLGRPFWSVASLEDEDGNITTFDYRTLTNGNPRTVVDPPLTGTTDSVVYDFDERGRLKEVINALNYKRSSSFSSTINLKKIAEAILPLQSTNLRNYRTSFEYSGDGRGNRERITEALGTAVASIRQTQWQTEEDLGSTDANLTNQNLLKKLTLPGVGSSSYDFTHTDTGQITQSKDPLNRAENMRYNASGQVIEKSDAKGYKTTYTYDAKGYLHTVTDPDNNTTVYETRNALGRVIAVKDKRGNTSYYTYDAAGNVLTEKNPLNGVTRYDYDANGNLSKITDPNLNDTKNTYTKGNRLKTTLVTVAGVSYTQSFGFDALNRVISTTNRNNRTSQTGYDLVGNVKSEADPLNNSVTYNYDANNNIIKSTDEEGRIVTYLYDALDRVTEVKDSKGNMDKTSYNAQGLIASRTDARNNTTSYEYDVAGQLVKVIDPKNGVTRITYDDNGNKSSVTDPNNHTTTYEYDRLSRLVKLDDGDGHMWRYSYDENGNQTRETKPDGSHIDTVYDANGRVSKVKEYSTTGSLTRTISYGYDANGNVISKSNGGSTLSYTYDELNRIKTAADHFGKVIGYRYDGVGNLTRLTYPGNKNVGYTYDIADQLKQVTDWLGNNTAYTRNDAGQVTKIKLGNGSEVIQGYDSVGRMTSLVNRKSNSEVISSYEMTLDQAGNITRASVELPQQPELPDSTTMSYDPTNRITQGNGATFAHDPNGRLIEQTKTGDTIEYSFNPQDLITGIKTNGVVTASYSYDANNNRVGRTIDAAETRFVVDTNASLSRMLAETNTSGAVQRYYIYGEGLISQIDASNTTKYYHYDPTGNTLALTDDSQNVADKYAYTPYGLPTSDGSTQNSFLYSGKHGVMDDGNGLNYMRARYYKADIRRFLSLDALMGEVVSTQSLNRFAYVQGNPIMMIDPSGYEPESEPEPGFKKRFIKNIVAFKKGVVIVYKGVKNTFTNETHAAGEQTAEECMNVTKNDDNKIIVTGICASSYVKNSGGALLKMFNPLQNVKNILLVLVEETVLPKQPMKAEALVEMINSVFRALEFVQIANSVVSLPKKSKLYTTASTRAESAIKTYLTNHPGKTKMIPAFQSWADKPFLDIIGEVIPVLEAILDSIVDEEDG